MESSSKTHLKPQKDPKTETRAREDRDFVRSVIKSAHYLKTGNDPGFGTWLDARSFANQKAKAIHLSGHSYPVFLIRKPKQRGSYSDAGEGDMKSPSTGTNVKL